MTYDLTYDPYFTLTNVSGLATPIVLLFAAGLLTHIVTGMKPLACGVTTAIPTYAVVLSVLLTGWSDAASQGRAAGVTSLTILVAALPGVLGAQAAFAGTTLLRDWRVKH